jgi:acyl-CoA synthetase (NDP forming)
MGMIVNIDYIFHPRSVAVAGISADHTKVPTWLLLQPLLECGFKGKIYPVNHRADEILGLKSYPTISDIPGVVDYVISKPSSPSDSPIY